MFRRSLGVLEKYVKLAGGKKSFDFRIDYFREIRCAVLLFILALNIYECDVKLPYTRFVSFLQMIFKRYIAYSIKIELHTRSGNNR